MVFQSRIQVFRILDILPYSIMMRFLRQTNILLLLMIMGALPLRAQDIEIGPISKLSICQRDTVYIPYTVSNPFPAGNVFTAEMSDAAGSFAAPAVVGSVAAMGSGYIVCSIPKSVTAATGYVIRIASSIPANYSSNTTPPLSIRPVSTISIVTNSPLCATDTLHFKANTVPRPDTIKWYFPNGMVVAGQLVDEWRDVPDYAGTTMAVSTLAGCKDTAYTTVTVKPAPDTAAITSNSPLCEGDTLKLTATPPAGTSPVFKWYGQGGFTTTLQNPEVPNVPLSYSGEMILYTVANGCRSFPAKHHISVMPRPQKPVATSNSPICEGENLDLDATDVPGARYIWHGPFGVEANFRNPSIPSLPVSATGYYIVIDSVGSCWNSDTIFAEIKAYPQKPVISYDPACTGDTLRLHTGDNAPGIIYNWMGPNNYRQAIQHPEIYNATTANNGKYIVYAANGRCVTWGDSAEVAITPSPDVPVAGNNGPLTEGELLKLTASSTTPGVSYSWTGPNNFSSNEQNTDVGFAEMYNAGTYIVTVAKDGCISSAITNVVVNAGITKNDFKLYPSPNNGTFTIAAHLEMNQAMPLEIVNAAGQCVYKAEINSDNRKLMHTIDLKDRLAGGVYYIKIKMDGRTWKRPFTVVR